jgi:drug/metabolite transporter (DMT)-like permease
VAGAVGPVALGCFYRGLAIGTMSVVAPISATAVAVPVVAGLATGDEPGQAAIVGIVLAAAGIVLASREAEHEGAPAPQASRASIGLALCAALGFGIFLTALPAASDASVPWALLLARAVSVAMCAAALLTVADRRHPRSRDTGTIVAIGVLDAGANALYALASTKGLLSIVSVLGSLYPVTTVILAWLLLHERLARVQQAGVVLAFAGVTLISL